MQDEKPLRKQEILSKGLGDEVVLYSKDGKTIHVLNRTAHMIWELCDGQHSAQDMEKVLRANFQLLDPQPDIAGDIARSLQLLLDAGLLQPTIIHSLPTSMPKP